MSEDLVSQRKQFAQVIANDPELIATMVARLEGASRRERQNAASVLSLVASSDASLLAGHADAIVDALNRPEAQTRWECLDILSTLVGIEAKTCEKAIPGAESALFDEDSGSLRLAALRFLCRIGATSGERSDTVWPLIDEAIQCYHGDYEFQDMLLAVIAFAEGDVSSNVKAALSERMAFDARNGKGILKKRAQQIVDILA